MPIARSWFQKGVERVSGVIQGSQEGDQSIKNAFVDQELGDDPSPSQLTATADRAVLEALKVRAVGPKLRNRLDGETTSIHLSNRATWMNGSVVGRRSR